VTPSPFFPAAWRDTMVPPQFTEALFFKKNPATLKLDDNVLFLFGDGFFGGNDFIL
jgi:hypothetical protein